MGQRGFCGCCSLKSGGVFTGLLAAIYNGSLAYSYAKAMGNLQANDDLFLVLRVLFGVLIFLAVTHVAISLLLIYAAIKSKADLVMLWIVTYTSSCLVVASLFTVGLAFMTNKAFLYILLCNALFVFNVVLTGRLYTEMVENLKKDCV